MSVKLLTEQHLEFLSLKGGCTGSSESTLVKKPHCCKSHVMALIMMVFIYNGSNIHLRGLLTHQIPSHTQGLYPKINGNRSYDILFHCYRSMRGSRGGGWAGGPDPPPPPVKSKNIGSLSNTGPDSLKKYKATKLFFNVGHHRHASKTPFKWSRITPAPCKI